MNWEKKRDGPRFTCASSWLRPRAAERTQLQVRQKSQVSSRCGTCSRGGQAGRSSSSSHGKPGLLEAVLQVHPRLPSQPSPFALPTRPTPSTHPWGSRAAQVHPGSRERPAAAGTPPAREKHGLRHPQPPPALRRCHHPARHDQADKGRARRLSGQRSFLGKGGRPTSQRT